MSNQEEHKDLVNFNIPKENPFKVPADYFENLPIRLAERIQIENQKKAWNWSRFFFKPSFAISFSFAVFIAVMIIFRPQVNEKEFLAQTDENRNLYSFLTFDETDEAEMAEAYYYAMLSSKEIANPDEESEHIAQLLAEEDIVWTDFLDELTMDN